MSSNRRALKREAKGANKSNLSKLSQATEETKKDAKSYQFEEDLNFEGSADNNSGDQPSLEHNSRSGGGRKRTNTHRSDNATQNEEGHQDESSSEEVQEEGEKRKFITYEAEDGSSTIYHVPSFLLKTYEIVDVKFIFYNSLIGQEI